MLAGATETGFRARRASEISPSTALDAVSRIAALLQAKGLTYGRASHNTRLGFPEFPDPTPPGL